MWGQDGLILAEFFCCVFVDRDEVEVKKMQEKNEVNIQSSWPNKLGQYSTVDLKFLFHFYIDKIEYTNK